MEKKHLLAIILAAAIALLASCSGDGIPDPGAGGQGNRPGPLDADAKSMTIDRDMSGSIVAMDIAHRKAFPSRGMLDESGFASETLLVNYDDSGAMEPLVFRNDDGKYIVFTLADSYPITDNCIAFDPDIMYVSDEWPVIKLYRAKDSETGDELIFPAIENLEKAAAYMVSGTQVLMNITGGKAAILNDIDFSRFTSSDGGKTYVCADTLSVPYDMDDSVVYGRDLYTVGKADGTIWRIDLGKLENAVPLNHPGAFRAEKILAVSGKALIVKGSDAFDSGVYLVDMAELVVPVLAEGRKVTVSDGRYSGRLLNAGSFENEFLHDGAFWNASVLTGTVMDLYGSDGMALSGDSDSVYDGNGISLDGHLSGSTAVIGMKEYDVLTHPDGTCYIENKAPVLFLSRLAVGYDLGTAIAADDTYALKLTDFEGFDSIRILNVTDADPTGRITVFVLAEQGELCSVFEVSFDTAEKKLKLEGERRFLDIRVPRFAPSPMTAPAERKNGNEFKWSGDGSVLYWLADRHTLMAMDMRNEEPVRLVFPNEFADNELEIVGDMLYFSLYRTVQEIGTYSLDTGNLRGSLRMVSADRISIKELSDLRRI